MKKAIAVTEFNTSAGMVATVTISEIDDNGKEIARTKDTSIILQEEVLQAIDVVFKYAQQIADKSNA